MHSHADDKAAVLDAVGLTMADLFDSQRGAEYHYPDGRRVRRTPDKKFSQNGNTKGRSLFRTEFGDATTVYVAEGEQDVLALESAGVAATCSAMGAGKAHFADWSPLAGKTVVIVADNDDPGRKHAQQVSAQLDGIANTVRVVVAKVGKDFADHYAAGYGLDDLEPRAATESEDTTDLLADIRSAAELDDMVLPPLVEHIPWLVTEGFGFLAGAPKVGKSWLAIALALAVAQGGMVLNSIKVEPRAVLLLALEDGDRRLQTRMRAVNGDDPLPGNLDYLTDVTPQVLIPTITAWLARHAADENPPLVILDTFGKARGQRRPGEDPYIADYQLGTQFKQAAKTVPGSAILAVHHTRKMSADDFVATVAGSQGITGSADYVLVLTRKRKSDEGLLSVTGRDIHEEEYALLVTNGIWHLDGYNLIMAAEAADERRDKGNLNERSQAVLEFVNSRAQTSPGDLVTELGIERRQASVYLSRLLDAGRIRKTGRGTYAPLLEVVT